MSIASIYTDIDALTVAAPNLAAVRMIATLREIPFEQALVEQARDWCTALDEAIDRSAQEAAIAIGNAEGAAMTGAQRAKWYAEAHDHLTEVYRLTQIRNVAAQMLADADTNRLDGRPVRTVELPDHQ
ncbi:hypothetical protein DFR67_1164 [Williamsia limnetica]|jgi:hypothetical protein|uniref:PE family protein n=1 Tax=Williamsia limnetica TaxID=882452 RepID=A0A318RG36_WILLI|nr:hypothetical protein [Williamsia limnetica]PYE13450.1 hypothetical protein DFR67_1164 [Williamsia limnetica]